MNLPAGFSIGEITEALAGLSAKEKGELLSLLARAGSKWLPLPGPQSEAAYSLADITGYGGAAGGGKTDLACGLALTEHQRSILYRREAAQLTAIEDRIEEMLGTRAGFNGSKGVWRIGKGRQVEFGGFPNLGDEKRFQGRAHDFKVFDEVTEMAESQVRFLMGWLRSAKPDQRKRVLMTLNARTTAEGRWVISFFGPWLDKNHPLYPAKPGELLWCTTIKGRDHWVPDDRPFILSEEGERDYDFDATAVLASQIVRPLSRTFIPARVTDNPFYVNSGYLAVLQALPEPWRSQMLNGDFEAGIEDDEKQLIPSAWIRAAMDRWVALDRKGYNPGQMSSMGVDPAQGGRDRFVIARRHGRWFAPLLSWRGQQIKDGAMGAMLVLRYRRNNAPVHADTIGWGADTCGALESNGIQTIRVNVAAGSDGQLAPGLRFANLRAELMWTLREALNPDGDHPVALPDDPELEQELCAYRMKPVRGGVLVNSKDDIKAIIGRSPDKGDAVALGLMDTPRDSDVIDMVEQMRHLRRASGAGDRYDELLEG